MRSTWTRSLIGLLVVAVCLGTVAAAKKDKAAKNGKEKEDEEQEGREQAVDSAGWGVPSWTESLWRCYGGWWSIVFVARQDAP